MSSRSESWVQTSDLMDKNAVAAMMARLDTRCMCDCLSY